MNEKQTDEYLIGETIHDSASDIFASKYILNINLKS